jgi:hypothetical protein
MKKAKQCGRIEWNSMCTLRNVDFLSYDYLQKAWDSAELLMVSVVGDVMTVGVEHLLSVVTYLGRSGQQQHRIV